MLVKYFLIVIAILFAIVSCENDNYGTMPYPNTNDGQLATVEGSFILSTVSWDGDTMNAPVSPNNYYGQVFDFAVNQKTQVLVSKSEALYNISNNGFFNIDLVAYNEQGKIIFSLQLNDVFSEVSYLNAYSKSYLPLYPSGAYYFDSTGKFYEAAPSVPNTSGVVYLDMYFVTWPKVGDTIEGYFSINMKYQTTYIPQ